MAGRFRSRGPVFRFVKCFGKNFLENIFKKCIDFFPEMAYNEYNNKREVFEAKFPAIPEEVKRFEEGKYYPFNITINYFTGVEISASIDPWQYGWSEGTENDNIGEDAPSGAL